MGSGAARMQQAGTEPRWEPRWPSQSPWDDQREPRHHPQPQQMPAKVSGQLTFPVLLSRPRVPRGVCKQAPVSPVLTFKCLVPTADSCGWPPPRATPPGLPLSRDTLKPKMPLCSCSSLFSRVLLPAPEGPLRTTGLGPDIPVGTGRSLPQAWDTRYLRGDPCSWLPLLPMLEAGALPEKQN